MGVTPVISDEMRVGQGVTLTVRDTSVSFRDNNALFVLTLLCAADREEGIRHLVVSPYCCGGSRGKKLVSVSRIVNRRGLFSVCAERAFFLGCK